MAKTIMIADKLYEELKRVKGSDKSFTDVIAEALKKSESERKTIGNLIRKHAGALKDYKEDKEAVKWLRDTWRRWDKRLNREMNKGSF